MGFELKSVSWPQVLDTNCSRIKHVHCRQRRRHLSSDRTSRSRDLDSYTYMSSPPPGEVNVAEMYIPPSGMGAHLALAALCMPALASALVGTSRDLVSTAQFRPEHILRQISTIEMLAASWKTEGRLKPYLSIREWNQAHTRLSNTFCLYIDLVC